MGDRSKIEWTDATWNPIRARRLDTGAVGHYCEMPSPGCAHCYAAEMQRRFGLPRFPGARRGLPTLPVIGANGAVQVAPELEVYLDEQVLAQPLRWRRPRRVFVCSMSDLFGEWVPDRWIAQIFAVMSLAERHTFQVLTKRAERLPLWSDWIYQRSALLFPGVDVDANVVLDCVDTAAVAREIARVEDDFAPLWPLANVQLGVSVENRAQLARIEPLCRTPAAVRFVSAEPLLEDLGDVLGWLDLGLDWVIAGGESGPRARRCELDWIRSIVAQCRRAKVACFVKQLGACPIVYRPETMLLETRRKIEWDDSGEYISARLVLKSRKGGDPEEWPEDLRIREMPMPEGPRCDTAKAHLENKRGEASTKEQRT